MPNLPFACDQQRTHACTVIIATRDCRRYMRNGILILDIISVLPFWLLELIDAKNTDSDVSVY